MAGTGTNFGIAIKVDPGNAKSTVDGVADSLSKVEAVAAKLTDRLRDQSGRFSSTGAAAKETAEGVRVLTEEEQEFERMVLLGNAAKGSRRPRCSRSSSASMQQLEREIGKLSQHAAREGRDRREHAFTDAITKRNQALAKMQPRSQADFDSDGRHAVRSDVRSVEGGRGRRLERWFGWRKHRCARGISRRRAPASARWFPA